MNICSIEETIVFLQAEKLNIRRKLMKEFRIVDSEGFVTIVKAENEAEAYKKVREQSGR